MNLSDKGRRLLEEWEGRESKMYKDSAGYPTIGVGHKLRRHEITSGKIDLFELGVIEWYRGLNDVQIDALLDQDLEPAIHAIGVLLDDGLVLTQNQFDALVSFIHNVGVGAFETSTLRKRLVLRRLEDIPHQLERWHWAGGEPHVLTTRRAKEIQLWNSEADSTGQSGTIEDTQLEKRIKLLEARVAEVEAALFTRTGVA